MQVGAGSVVRIESINHRSKESFCFLGKWRVEDINKNNGRYILKLVDGK